MNTAIEKETDNAIIYLIKNFFVARKDVYALQNRTEDDRCGYGTIRAPLTSQVLSSHLKGDITIGIYPFVDNTTKWLIFDLDIPDVNDLIQVKGRLLHHGIPGYLEYSGRNWHLWVFFEQPVSNCIARKLAEFILNEAHCQNPLEIFPKQDEITNVGSCIKLPFGINRKSEEYSYFVNGGLASVPDLAAFLQSVEKVEESHIKEIFEANGIVVPQLPALIINPSLKFVEPCIEKYWSEGAKERKRAWVSYQIAIRMKEMGFSVEKALGEMSPWLTRCEEGKSPFTKEELVCQVRNAYEKKPPKKAKCGSNLLKDVCTGKDTCPFFKSLKGGIVKQGHNNDMYLRLSWQKILSSGQLLMVGYALPLIEKEKRVRPGEELFTTKKELTRWSGLSEPGRALAELKKLGLIEYIPGNRGGDEKRRPTVIKRLTPIPKPS